MRKKKKEENFRIARFVMNKGKKEVILPYIGRIDVSDIFVEERKNGAVLRQEMMCGDIIVEHFNEKGMKEIISKIKLNDIKYITIEEAIPDGSSRLEEVINLPKENRYTSEMYDKTIFHFGKEE